MALTARRDFFGKLALAFGALAALVSSIARNAGDFPIPVAIVPGHLSDEELDAMS